MALLIDPTAKTVTHVDFDGTLEQAYALTECSIVTVARIEPGLGTLILDEEGMLKANLQPFKIMSQMYVGKALVVGQRGWKTEPKLDLELARELVKFLP